MTAAPYLQAPGTSRRGVAIVVALHAAAFWLLLQLNVVSLPAPLAVLSVSLIPSVPAMRPPEITPPPKPLAKRPLPPQAVAQPMPLAVAASTAVPAAIPPAAALPAPPAAPAADATAPPAPSAPRFDADYLYNPKPVYPSLSRRLGEEGKVVLRVYVLADGRADGIQLDATSGSPRLDQAAQEAVRRWRFVPARQGEAAVAAWVVVPIVFTLKE